MLEVRFLFTPGKAVFGANYIKLSCTRDCFLPDWCSTYCPTLHLEDQPAVLGLGSFRGPTPAKGFSCCTWYLSYENWKQPVGFWKNVMELFSFEK